MNFISWIVLAIFLLGIAKVLDWLGFWKFTGKTINLFKEENRLENNNKRKLKNFNTLRKRLNKSNDEI